ncbi:MAG: hypothetical protein WCO00_14100, partial [Rhodospirillaceae bacterium]
MDTALGILSRSPQAASASGPGPTTGSTNTNDLFATLFSRMAANSALQAGKAARSNPLPAPTTQTLAPDPRPAPDYGHPGDTATDSAPAAKADSGPDQPAAKTA